MPRPPLLELASEGERVGVPAAADPPDSERALALARLGAMSQERLSLMTKLHRNLLESKRLQVEEEYDGCCCATCHAKCFSPSLLLLLAEGPGAVMAAPLATSSRGDSLTAWPEESNDIWGKLLGNIAGRVGGCLPMGWLAIPMCPRSFVVPVSVHSSNHCLRKLRSMTFLGTLCGWLGPGARECL